MNYNVTPGQKLTEEEREEIRNAKKLKPQFDEDCPEMSETMLKSLKAAVRNRDRRMNKASLSDLEARKRDHKVYITDEAIQKVPFIQYECIEREHYDIIQGLARDVLKISKEQNDSNEVAIIYSLEWKKLQEKGLEFMGISIGDEHSVNPTESTVAYHLVHSTLDCAVICMHNHPNLSKISLDDIKFFLRNESIKMLAAVTNLGNIFYVVKETEFDWNAATELFGEAVAMHNLDPGDIKNAQKAANYFLSNCNKANIIYKYK